MTDCRVNRDINEFYTQIDKDESKMADNEQAEQDRIDSRTDLIMGGDDDYLLAEVLAESQVCVKALSSLCAWHTDTMVEDMTLRQVRMIAGVARLLTRSIQREIKNGVAEGHYS